MKNVWRSCHWAHRVTRLGVVTRCAGAFLALVLLASPLIRRAESPAYGEDTEAEVDFRRDVAPILARRCLTCHDAQKHKGDFRLDTKPHLLESGYVEPGEADTSELVQVISPQDNKAPRMPKDSDPLSQAEVALIRKWIDAGANWPDGFRLEPPRVTDTNWWSLKPIAAVSPPKLDVEGQRWIRTPIDAFIYAKLREHDLKPSAEADRRTLIRRLYFDLVGLPPTPEEVNAFVRDEDPKAYDRLVDHLLDSPHYGERWARHWLDVVHYADTHGYDKDKLRPNAWPYRDYVIRAFNEDKPYGRFVKEQLAGDALWPDTMDGPVATGFIASGPWDFIGHAEVPETKFDGKVARNLDRDNMVTNTMNTFCSLTIQCARCHHHKLDPVTMEDYYRLQAVFAAIDRADRSFDSDPKVAAKRAELLEEQENLKAQLLSLAADFKKKRTPEIVALDAQIQEAEKRKADGASNVKIARSPHYGYHSQVANREDEVKWVQADLGRVLDIDTVYLSGADEYGWADFGFPHRFTVSVAKKSDFSDAIVVADHRDRDVPRPGTALTRIDAKGVSGRYVRITATKLWNRRRTEEPLSRDWIFAIGELAAVSNDRLIAPVAVQAKDSIESMPRWGRDNLVDGIFGQHSLDALMGDARRSGTNGYHSQFATESETTKWIQVALPKEAKLERISILPAFPTDWPDTPGFGFPLRFRVETSLHADFRDAKTLFSAIESDFANPKQRPVVIDAQDVPARYVRLTATKLWDRGGAKHALAVAELQIWSDGRNIALGAQSAASDSIESGRWAVAYLVDGFTSRMPIAAAVAELDALARPSESAQQLEQLITMRTALFREAVGEKALNHQQRLQKQQLDIGAALKALPAAQKVYAGVVHHGSGAFRGRGGMGPREIHVLHRGDLKSPGQRVGPGVAPLIPGVAAQFELTDEDPEWMRRVQLADWIVHPDNPLTWRSIVNRIWQHHFGQGIVDTPNDFGRGGGKPTHPQLLDWLAAHFRDNGQSVKHLHRMMVRSAAYRQASTEDQKAAKVDAGNRWLWRMNRRRLTAEEIRDTVLAVTGRLDRTPGGPGYMDFVIEHPQHSPHYEYEKHDPNDPKTHRRAIYRFIVRSQPQPFMDTLDCADPSMSVPKRSETLTSLQALAMLNNRFMVAMAEQFSKRLDQECETDAQRVGRAIQLCLSRRATQREVELLSEFARQHGSKNLCRLIFNLSEFVFID